MLSFIETNCVVFESVDENKLEYTGIHNEFKDLSEKLIEMMLAELSTTNEMFGKAFAEAPETEGLNRIKMILDAIDDFEIFKKMMVGRNDALTEQAKMVLQRREEKEHRRKEKA